MYKYNVDVDFNIATSHGLIASKITKGSRILEFGCGNGYLAAYAKSTLECSVTGIDISAEAIKTASAHLEQGIVANVEEKEWEQELLCKEFDVIIFSDVLEHLHAPADLLRRSLAYLKPDGKILCAVSKS